MARGFWTGFLHGGLVGVTALAALLLAVPLPQPDAEAGAQPAQATVLPVAPDTPATAEVPEDSPVPQSGEAEEAVAAPPPAGTPQADVPVADPRPPMPLSPVRSICPWGPSSGAAAILRPACPRRLPRIARPWPRRLRSWPPPRNPRRWRSPCPIRARSQPAIRTARSKGPDRGRGCAAA
ncbi:hypothetical protein ACFSYD_08550 [Paracoccus aerius]